VLHAVVIGTPEATYDHLEGMETAQARRERIRLRDRLLTRTDLTTAERATLLDAQATDACSAGRPTSTSSMPDPQRSSSSCRRRRPRVPRVRLPSS